MIAVRAAAGGGGSTSAAQQYVWVGGDAPLSPIIIPPAALARARRTLRQLRLAFLFASTTGIPPRTVKGRWRQLAEGERAAWRLRSVAAFAPAPADAAAFADMPVLMDAGGAEEGEGPQRALPDIAPLPLWFGGYANVSYPSSAYFKAMKPAAMAANPALNPNDGYEIYIAVRSMWAATSADAKLQWELCPRGPLSEERGAPPPFPTPYPLCPLRL